MKEQVITEYNENEDIPFLDENEEGSKNPDFSTEEEKIFSEPREGTVRVLITEPKITENNNNDYI
jgi:hypothetical protein